MKPHEIVIEWNEVGGVTNVINPTKNDLHVLDTIRFSAKPPATPRVTFPNGSPFSGDKPDIIGDGAPRTVRAEAETAPTATFPFQCEVIDANGIIRHHNKDRNDPPDTIVTGAVEAVQKLEKS